MLSLENLSAGYGGFQALFEVNLDVKACEAVAVIGPSGAGKTTLLRAISKLVEPTAGGVFFENKNLAAVPSHEVVSLGIAHVPENRRLFARLTVAENLRMGGFPAACRKKNPEGIEMVFGLFPVLRQRRAPRAGPLSGGGQAARAIGP